jgi:hypothetical protein
MAAALVDTCGKRYEGLFVSQQLLLQACQHQRGQGSLEHVWRGQHQGCVRSRGVLVGGESDAMVAVQCARFSQVVVHVCGENLWAEGQLRCSLLPYLAFMLCAPA